MALDKRQILELLGTGLAQDVVARAVGCEPSYITQLMSQEEFASEVIALRTQALTAHTERDRKIDGIEDTLIGRLTEAVESRLIYKPTDLLRAFAVINGAKRRGVPAQEQVGTEQTVINLTLPTQVVANFTMNSQGEVIEAQGKTLVTMSAHSLVQKLAKERAGQGGNKYDDLQKFLPPASAGEQATGTEGS